ncbi:hypothetical protein C4K29_3833 [Pseudomonas chlororaphis subsp. piscium]|nr:hypothetical protein C4K29_3833 [Pseudomonas chlororaphis subsp. piscium]
MHGLGLACGFSVGLISGASSDLLQNFALYLSRGFGMALLLLTNRC